MEEVQPRVHQLDADRDRQRAADDSADDGEHQVHRPDVLVIGRIDVAAPSMRRVMLFVRLVCRCRSCHVLSSTFLTAAARCWFYSAFAPIAAATAMGALSVRAYFFLASSTHAANACSLTTRTAIGMKA